MAHPQPRAPAPGPRFVRHAKRVEWGVGLITDVYAGAVRVRFADGQIRTFRGDVLETVAADTVPADLFPPQEPMATLPARAARPRARPKTKAVTGAAPKAVAGAAPKANGAAATRRRP